MHILNNSPSFLQLSISIYAYMYCYTYDVCIAIPVFEYTTLALLSTVATLYNSYKKSQGLFIYEI